MARKKTTEEFIKDAKNIHGDRYDYNKVNYTGNKDKIIIVCKIHGEFLQSPNDHLSKKSGCAKCGKLNITKTTKEFIHDARKIHENEYDYNKVNYINSREKVIIICKAHGEFLQSPNHHLSNKSGCPDCYGNKLKTTEQFIRDCLKVHGDRYDYSKVIYLGSNMKISIICHRHQEFCQIAYDHLNGHNCPKCKNSKTQEEFITDCLKIHGNRYDYSEVQYTINKEKIKITCRIHGRFVQRANAHLSGQNCPSCKSSKGESIIKLVLEKNNISFIQQQTFKDCDYKSSLKYDFYLPDHNLLIEYDGIQHFKPVEFFGGEESFKEQKIKDNIKNEYSKESGISLLRIFYNIKDEKIEELILKVVKTKDKSIEIFKKTFYLNLFDKLL